MKLFGTHPMMRQRGVTLVELMVGMVIGMMAVLVITQVMSISEGQRRSATTGSDAQTNGALALYTLQRDVQMAGYGMTVSAASLGCEIRAQFNGSNLGFVLVPVVITNAANGMPDTISMMMSSKRSFVPPIRVIVDHPRTAANFFVNSSLGVEEGDMMVAVPKTPDANNWCSIFNVTKDGSQGGGGGNGQGGGQGQNQVLHNSGASGPWNQPGGQTIFPNAGYPAGTALINIGQLVNRTYTVNNALSLEMTSFVSTTAATTTAELFPQIVNLQAMYGRDTNADDAVDTYDNFVPATAADWAQVKAVRIAVVARSAQFEREVVTTAEPLWDIGASYAAPDATPCGNSQCITLKIDHLADWQNYRYKVYDTVVPLRNVIWGL